MGAVHPLPIVLTSVPIAIPVNTPYRVINVPQGIRNTEATGILIDKIIFAAVPRVGFAGLEASLQIEIKWHNEQVTNGIVVLGGITYPTNRDGERQANVRVVALSKPLYLEPGDYLTVTLVTGIMGGVNPAGSVQVSAVGRQALVPPTDRWLPYLSTYLGPIYASNSGAIINDQSTPANLGNPYDTPLVIERMIGRVFTSGATGFFVDLEPSLLWNTFNMRVSDHRDNWWVAVPTPLPLVTSTVDRSWLLKHTLEPKGFLRIEFEGIANVADPTGAGRLARAVIGTVGYRRIET